MKWPLWRRRVDDQDSDPTREREAAEARLQATMSDEPRITRAAERAQLHRRTNGWGSRVRKAMES
jgi:hypothetical protein